MKWTSTATSRSRREPHGTWPTGSAKHGTAPLPEHRFEGPVEVDETFVGGLERHKHRSKRLKVGGGTGGKVVVEGMKDRAANQVRAAVMPKSERWMLQIFIRDRARRRNGVHGRLLRVRATGGLRA